MGLFYQDEEDEFEAERHSFSPRVGTMIAAVSGVILVILVIVLATNNKSTARHNTGSSLSAKNAQSTVAPYDTDNYDRTGKDIEQLYRDGKLRAEDLDIWDMYGKENNVVRVKNETPAPEETQNPDILPPYEIPDGSASPVPSASPSPDGGQSPAPDDEVLIKDVKLNTIDYTGLRLLDDKLSYYQNGEETSKLGVELSSDNGSVDFSMLKNNGVSFVMLKVAQRGYDTGIITIDPSFEYNARGAGENGIAIGLYISSQAVSTDEAIEEAHCCMDVSKDFNITYPVAFVYDDNNMNSSRAGSLSPEERTKIIDAFCSELKMYGYTPIIYGTEDFILNKTEPERLLKQYDVYLNDMSNMPHYPYQYKLWKYAPKTDINGVQNKACYIASFTDYSAR